MMQRTTVVATVRPPIRTTGLVTKRINATKLQTEPGAEDFRDAFSAGLGELNSGTDLNSTDITRKWAALSEKLRSVTQDILGHRKKRHPDWFDENNGKIFHIIDQRN